MVGTTDLVETILGRLAGHTILGVIPVDMRDMVIHPALALVVLHRGGSARPVDRLPAQ